MSDHVHPDRQTQRHRPHLRDQDYHFVAASAAGAGVLAGWLAFQQSFELGLIVSMFLGVLVLLAVVFW